MSDNKREKTKLTDAQMLEYLKKTQYECYIKSIAHSVIGEKYIKLNKLIGFPIPIILSISSAVSYATDPDVSRKDLSKSILYTVASVNILVAAISAVQQYFQYGKLGEKHMQSSFTYSAIYRKIKYFLHNHQSHAEIITFDEAIQFKINMAEEISEPLNVDVVSKVMKENPDTDTNNTAASTESPNINNSASQQSPEGKNRINFQYFRTQTQRKRNQFNVNELEKLYSVDDRTLKNIACYFTFMQRENNQGSIISTYEHIKSLDKESILNYILIDLNIDYDTINIKLDESLNGKLNMLDAIERRITPTTSPSRCHSKHPTAQSSITRPSMFGGITHQDSISLIQIDTKTLNAPNPDSPNGKLTFDDLVAECKTPIKTIKEEPLSKINDDKQNDQPPNCIPNGQPPNYNPNNQSDQNTITNLIMDTVSDITASGISAISNILTPRASQNQSHSRMNSQTDAINELVKKIYADDSKTNV